MSRHDHPAYEGLRAELSGAIEQAKCHLLIDTAAHLQLALSCLAKECEEWERINSASLDYLEGLK